MSYLLQHYAVPPTGILAPELPVEWCRTQATVDVADRAPSRLPDVIPTRPERTAARPRCRALAWRPVGAERRSRTPAPEPTAVVAGSPG